MTNAPPLLEARSLGRRQRGGSDHWLLRAINLAVHGGDRLAIIGPTGSGKTLLLRSLAVLDASDEGEVFWQGQAVSPASTPQYRRQAIYLHQRPVLVEGTVEENLRLPYSLHAHAAGEFNRPNVLDLLKRVGRGSEFMQQAGQNLSGGERQLVAVIRALQLSPPMLLLDEPTASLDENTSWTIEELVKCWQQGSPETRAFLWVTHDPEQAARVSNRTVAVRDGRVEVAEHE
jgi:putative ABC transport system ATP-binding protein